MTKFNVGDRVRVLNDQANFADVSVGDEFTVGSVDTDGNGIPGVTTIQDSWWLTNDNIELVSETEQDEPDGVWIVLLRNPYAEPDFVEAIYNNKEDALEAANGFSLWAKFVRFGENPYEDQ